MGIFKFTSVFKPVGETKLEKIKKVYGIAQIGIDAFQEIIRYNSVKIGLTNKKGKPTQHIKFLVNSIVKAEKLGLEQLWLLDNRDPTAAKTPALTRRKEARAVHTAKIAALTEEIKQMHEAKETLDDKKMAMLYPNYSADILEKETELKIQKIGDGITMHAMVRDLVFILKKLGVKYVVSPKDYESEQIGAYLCRMKQIQALITTDSDAMLFGCPLQLKKIPKKPGVYEIYTLDSCLKQRPQPDKLDVTKTAPLTMQQFVKGCVALGSDYTDEKEKQKGIGPATIFKDVDGVVVLAEHQQEAYNIFTKSPAGLQIEIIQEKRTPQSIEELIRWMVDEMDFPEAALRKTLSTLL